MACFVNKPLRFFENKPFAHEIIDDHDHNTCQDLGDGIAEVEEIHKDEQQRRLQNAGEKPGGNKLEKLFEGNFRLPAFGSKDQQLIYDKGIDHRYRPSNDITCQVVDLKQLCAEEVYTVVYNGSTGSPKNIGAQLPVFLK